MATASNCYATQRCSHCGSTVAAPQSSAADAAAPAATSAVVDAALTYPDSAQDRFCNQNDGLATDETVNWMRRDGDARTPLEILQAASAGVVKVSTGAGGLRLYQVFNWTDPERFFAEFRPMRTPVDVVVAYVNLGGDGNNPVWQADYRKDVPPAQIERFKRTQSVLRSMLPLSRFWYRFRGVVQTYDEAEYWHRYTRWYGTERDARFYSFERMLYFSGWMTRAQFDAIVAREKPDGDPFASVVGVEMRVTHYDHDGYCSGAQCEECGGGYVTAIVSRAYRAANPYEKRPDAESSHGNGWCNAGDRYSAVIGTGPARDVTDEETMQPIFEESVETVGAVDDYDDGSDG